MGRTISERQKAKDNGERFYYTGKPCSNGHTAERYTRSGKCVVCQRNWNTGGLRDYRRANKERINEQIRDWRRDNPDYNKRYYDENWDYYHEYRQNRKDKFNAYRRKRYAEDAEFKVEQVCRRLLKRALYSSGEVKKGNTYDLLQYGKKDLLESLEKKLLPGMSWDNYGEWHIDHAYPISWHVSRGIKDPSVINRLENLVPMWSEHNNQKHAKTLQEYLDMYPDMCDTYGHFLKEVFEIETEERDYE